MNDSATIAFTTRTQMVLAHARKQADRLGHDFVDSNHVFLGLIKLNEGIAVNVLRKMGLELETVRLELEMKIRSGPDQEARAEGSRATGSVGGVPLPYTPRAKKILALAAKEAKTLGHTYVGTEHF